MYFFCPGCPKGLSSGGLLISSLFALLACGLVLSRPLPTISSHVAVFSLLSILADTAVIAKEAFYDFSGYRNSTYYGLASFHILVSALTLATVLAQRTNLAQMLLPFYRHESELSEI